MKAGPERPALRFSCEPAPILRAETAMRWTRVILFFALVSSAARGEILVFSDLHVDPIDEEQPAFGTYGKDPPWALVEAALDGAQRIVPQPTAILLAGDYLAHDWQKRWAAAHPHATPQA